MKKYISIVPKLESTGPVIIAVELCYAMQKQGYEVEILSLAKTDDSTYKGIKSSQLTIQKISTLSKGCIVHSHTFRPDIACAFIGLFKKVRTLTTVHSYFQHALFFDYGRIKTQLAYVLWKIAVNSLDSRVFISNSMQRYYKYRLKRSNSYVVKNWRLVERNSEVFDGEVEEFISLQKKANRTRLVFCGSLDARKNIMNLIDNIDDSISLLILGDGPLRDAINSKVTGSENIKYIGKKKDALYYMGLNQCLVLPSFAEGIPTVCIEASSIGIPSLLSNISVHRELKSDGIALTFNHHNFIDFKKVIDLSLGIKSKDIIETWHRKFNGDLGVTKYLKVMTK